MVRERTGGERHRPCEIRSQMGRDVPKRDSFKPVTVCDAGCRSIRGDFGRRVRQPRRRACLRRSGANPDLAPDASRRHAAARSELSHPIDRDRRPSAANPQPAARFACRRADGLWRQPKQALRHRLPDPADHIDLTLRRIRLVRRGRGARAWLQSRRRDFRRRDDRRGVGLGSGCCRLRFGMIQ